MAFPLFLLDFLMGVVRLNRGGLPTSEAMYQRNVSLLLLPCLFLTPSAACGHSHGASEPTGHGLRSHYHIHAPPSDSCTHAPGHHHHRDHRRAGSHHHDEGDGASESASEPALRCEPLSVPEHDADAVYLDHVDFVVSERPAKSAELADLLGFTTPESQAHIGLCLESTRKVAMCACAPPPCAAICPLYICQCALLI